MTLVIVAFFMVVSLSVAIFIGVEREMDREHRALKRSLRSNYPRSQ